LSAFAVGRFPVGLLHVAWALLVRRGDLAPRTLTPRVARAAHWRSLNQDVPTSDVLFHRTGTTHRLQAALSLPPHVLQRASDSPAWSEPPRTNPVKGRSKTTQDAFHRIEKSLRHFTYGAIQSCASFCEEFTRKTRAPIRHHFHRRPRQFQRAIPYFRNDDFVLARSRLGSSSCDSPRCVIKDVSDRFLLPNTLSTSTRTRPLPVHRQDLRPAYIQ
jgi:hypothetical protein